MKRLLTYMCAAATALVILSAQTVSAEPVRLSVGGAWQQFYWNEVPGQTFEPGSLSADGYVLTTTEQSLTEQVYLNITDAFFPGDSFDVFVNGVLALSTPSVASSGSSISNPALAFGTAAYSWGRLTLSPGTYNIGVSVREGTRSGGGFIQATPTPEPATLLLLSTGLAGIGAAARKRRKARRDDLENHSEEQ